MTEELAKCCFQFRDACDHWPNTVLMLRLYYDMLPAAYLATMLLSKKCLGLYPDLESLRCEALNTIDMPFLQERLNAQLGMPTRNTRVYPTEMSVKMLWLCWWYLLNTPLRKRVLSHVY